LSTWAVARARLAAPLPDLHAHDGLIVQDLPEVISTTARSLTAAFNKIAHDWPDADVACILADIKAVVMPGYSKLFVCDVAGRNALDNDAGPGADELRERTGEDGAGLANAAGRGGIQIASISRHPRVVQCLIEVELA
jgi:hypothetical protein